MTEHFLVTGGSGGIGAALCRQLARQDVMPVIGYNTNRDTAEALASELGGHALHLDLSDDAAIDTALGWMTSHTPNLSGTVLAASPPPVLEVFGKIERDDLLDQLRINVIGPQRLLTGLVKQHFRPRKSGVVVAILTAAMGTDSQSATSSMGAYVTAKFGLKGLMAALSADYPWLSVGLDYPGFTETPMLNAFDDRYLELVKSSLPGNKFDQPDMVADRIMRWIEGAR